MPKVSNIVLMPFLWENGSLKGAAADLMMVKLRAGWIIMYAGCPMTWSLKLQTLTTLSTTEAEYMALSMVLQEQIPLLHLLKEVVAQEVNTTSQPATIHCKAFEDNNGALETAKQPKFRPRTKHLNNT